MLPIPHSFRSTASALTGGADLVCCILRRSRGRCRLIRRPHCKSNTHRSPVTLTMAAARGDGTAPRAPSTRQPARHHEVGRCWERRRFTRLPAACSLMALEICTLSALNSVRIALLYPQSLFGRVSSRWSELQSRAGLFYTRASPVSGVVAVLVPSCAARRGVPLTLLVSRPLTRPDSKGCCAATAPAHVPRSFFLSLIC